MSKTKNNRYFWAGYADLMTSLFFIMLVLYALTYLKLTNQKKATEEQLKKIQEVQSAVKKLPETYFKYDEEYKRFSLKRDIEFDKGSSEFKTEHDRDYLIAVGQSIYELIQKLKNENAQQDIQYVVLIEGMASDDKYPRNHVLSYERALAVAELWKYSDVKLDESICEIQVAGSGTGGIGRNTMDETKNQRILIQIIPKIGEIET